MPKFSTRSLANLATCHKDAQITASRAIERFDFAVIDGQRGKDKQEAYFRSGKSKLHFPDSLHNHAPSMAMDCVPWPVNYNDIPRFEEMARVIKEVAAELLAEGLITHRVEWGGDWPTFKDYAHFQFVKG